ncbi:MAG: DNA repair photolyase [Crocinitomix sp.]|jgi:DNA repair photolyase
MPKEKEVKSILNKTKKRDPWFLDDYTINLYSSCSFNCLYCYIRGSKYGLNLEQSLTVKTNAIEVLDRQLFNRAKKGKYGIIVLSSATDPYLKIEEDYQMTRQALTVILKHKFPVHMITKSSGIERDFDLLHDIDKAAVLPNDLKGKLTGGTIITYSFSTLDDKVGHIFEPGAVAPSIRLRTLEKTVKDGFLTGVSLMPLLPFISDTTEALNLFYETFKKINTAYVMPASITLFGNGKADSNTLILGAIKKHYPELENKYLKYFASGSEMPGYYKKAFKTKMEELALTYALKNRII